jgi:CRP/FNR family cyclic AMP-dependent transcriptional regulator
MRRAYLFRLGGYDRPVATLAEDLQRVRLFSCLNQRQLKRLSRDLKRRTFKPGMTPVRQGEMSGIGFFVIVEGEASVAVGGEEVARLGPGDHFGELGLLSGQARTATVTAETPLECLEMTMWSFQQFVKDNPDAAWALLRHLADLLVAAEARP